MVFSIIQNLQVQQMVWQSLPTSSVSRTAKRSRYVFGSTGLMPTCRLCKGQYPADQFIDGNGPRYLVCVRCAVEQGYLPAEEVPGLYDERTAMARMSLFARRYGSIFWLTGGWFLWAIIFQDIELWGNLTLVALIISTLLVPVLFFLRTAKFRAQLRQLTPK